MDTDTPDTDTTDIDNKDTECKQDTGWRTTKMDNYSSCACTDSCLHQQQSEEEGIMGAVLALISRAWPD